MAKFFGYRGYVGCDAFTDKFRESDIVEDTELQLSDFSDALLNNPLEPGQLGVVLDVAKCEFNEESLNILARCKKSNDDIGEIDFFKADDGRNIVGWMGGPMTLLNDSSEGSNSYDYEIIKNITPIELDIPVELKQYIDSIIDTDDSENEDELDDTCIENCCAE